MNSMVHRSTARVVSLIDDESLAGHTSTTRKLVAKFIVIANNGDLNLVLGLVSEFPYHADLVAHFCQSLDIASGWTRKPDLYEILDKHWKTKGGGWAGIDLAAGHWKFFGYSTAYGACDNGDLSFVVTEHPFFAGYSITITQ